MLCLHLIFDTSQIQIHNTEFLGGGGGGGGHFLRLLRIKKKMAFKKLNMLKQNLVKIKHKVRNKCNISYGPKNVIFVTLLINKC